ncbi:MAG: DUF3021 domain-containing protein [Clostridia bacterium]|nr:DUF3021 domain-containing protein [Clostridia bacterium]
MNKYAKAFISRGAVFAGFGPIITGIVLTCIPDVTLTGGEMLLAVVSTYLLAFVQAGASVFNQIEHWPLPKSLLCHFGSLYVVYSLCYLINSWMPFEPMVLLIFTAIFVAVYFAVWLTVYLSVRTASKKLNHRIDQ